MQRTFDFDEQMQMSEGVSDKKDPKDVLLLRFPHAINVTRASVSEDKSGTDYWITQPSGHKQSVDVKVRAVDCKRFGNDDVALETWSVLEKKKIGWTRDSHKRTDYILWIWQDTGRWMLVPFPLLCAVFEKKWEAWSKKYKSPIQPTVNKDGSHWHSQCVFVPRLLLWREMYDAFGGNCITQFDIC